MPSPFQTSPNALFSTRVADVRRLSANFIRVTLAGPDLSRFAPRGLDQRIKILLAPRGYPIEFVEPHLPESEWRRRWRALPAVRRPLLRSYTPSAVRPERCEIDLDFYIHSEPGPASTWALNARRGDRLIVSGPDVRLGRPSHGTQWAPGMARNILLVGDETTFPAVRNILASVDPTVHGWLLLEAADPADVASVHDGRHLDLRVVPRGTRRGGGALAPVVAEWVATHGATAAEMGDRFYAWIVTESSRVHALRDMVRAAGVVPGRVHAQGYWHDRPRDDASVMEVR